MVVKWLISYICLSGCKENKGGIGYGNSNKSGSGSS